MNEDGETEEAKEMANEKDLLEINGLVSIERSNNLEQIIGLHTFSTISDRRYAGDSLNLGYPLVFFLG